MSAPSLETLFDFETQIEAAISDLLDDLGLVPEHTDNDETLDTPRVEVVATVEDQGPHEISIQSGVISGRKIYDQFSCSVRISAIFDPTWTQAPQSMRGKVRKAILFITPESLNAKLSYLYVAANSLRQASGVRSVQGSEGVIETQASIDFQVFIRSDAWPTS